MTSYVQKEDAETLDIARALIAEGRGYGTWENRLAEALLAFEAHIAEIERERDDTHQGWINRTNAAESALLLAAQQNTQLSEALDAAERERDDVPGAGQVGCG